jgi:protocatechuate 3,4-dioxygenase beta subunit
MYTIALRMAPVDESHKSNEKFNASTDPKVVFAGNNACVLSPETTEGPFCRSKKKHRNCRVEIASSSMPDVTGESVRSEVIDDQAGIPLYLDLQVIDVNTCEPMEGIFLEIWSKYIIT